LNKIIEAIQSRCAILRFSILSGEDIIFRLNNIAKLENVTITDDRMETLVFSADGDMRQAINNLQSTHTGFGIVNKENVLKVCDIPHPTYVKGVIKYCSLKNLHKSINLFNTYLWKTGYSAIDILQTLFKVTKTMSNEELSEYQKLEYLKEIGFCHKRALEGCSSKLQILGLISRLHDISQKVSENVN